jgi:hypothetical protein
MDIHDLLSDQLMTWSANGRYSVVHPTQTTRPVAAANAGSGHAAEGLAHRTLQALWQTRLQVRGWPRPWPQVLPLRELSRPSSANGLRATGRSCRRGATSGEFPPAPRDHRRDLRDQPRTVTPPRGALRGPGEPAVAAHHLHRSAICRRAHRQYARGLACGRLRVGADRGERQ